jgi:glycosyltransferase involved in cell wall biosynthesis
MSEVPLVSVVTPVHNDGASLQTCIESVLAQSYVNWDLTLVDNASTDETPEIARAYATRDARIRHLRLEEFVDAESNYNRAFRAINPASAYCKVVAADDMIYPACLERMVEVAETSERIGIVGSYRRTSDGVDLVGLEGENVVDGPRVLRGQLLEQFSVIGGPSSFLLRSALVRERGDFLDSRFIYSDTEAVYRLLLRNSFGYVHDVLTFANRQAERTMVRARRTNARVAEQLRFVLRFGPSVFTPDQYRRQVRRRLWNYSSWQTKELWRRSRQDREFFRTHWDETEWILREGRGDFEVRAVIHYIRLLLARGGDLRRDVFDEPTSGGSALA